MGIKQSFINGVETVFGVFNEAVENGTYTSTLDDGFDTPVVSTDNIRVILDAFSQKDVGNLSFSKEIQPTDTIGLIPGKDFTLDVITGNTITIGTRVFTIVEFETDPYKVLYTTLLRDV